MLDGLRFEPPEYSDAGDDLESPAVGCKAIVVSHPYAAMTGTYPVVSENPTPANLQDFQN
jgi:hypothetical protein